MSRNLEDLIETLCEELKDIDLCLDYKSLSDKYKPEEVQVLIVGNAPPRDRYFYKEEPSQYDGLFLAVSEAMNPMAAEIYKMNRSVNKKILLLEEFKNRGGFMMDVYPKPEEDCRKEGDLSFWLDDFKNRVKGITLKKSAVVVLCHKNSHKLYSFFNDKGFKVLKVNCPIQRSYATTVEHKGTFVRKLSTIFTELE